MQVGGPAVNSGVASSGLQLAAAGIRKEPLDTPRQGLAQGVREVARGSTDSNHRGATHYISNYLCVSLHERRRRNCNASADAVPRRVCSYSVSADSADSSVAALRTVA
jgi:hypothetical protein